MATYKELKAQMDALAEKAEAARVAEYGITEKDIFGTRRGRPAKQAGAPVQAKYRDPKTGATWSGRVARPHGSRMRRIAIDS